MPQCDKKMKNELSFKTDKKLMSVASDNRKKVVLWFTAVVPSGQGLLSVVCFML